MKQKEEWRKVFYRDIKTKFRASKQEFNKYKRTRKVIYLQQASGKLFSAVENYLKIRYNIRKRSYRELWDMVKSNSNDRTLLQLTKQLHIFYYNGSLDM